MKISEFQKQIETLYLERDRERGLYRTFMWFSEEVGELARALHRDGDLEGEFADCLAWLSTLASLAGVDLEKAACQKYPQRCPKCESSPCSCPFLPEKPLNPLV
jgi:NTP pyrophosphatase (non-canonical NTP hydrolase)